MPDIRTQNEHQAYRLLQRVRLDIESRKRLSNKDWDKLLVLINDFIERLEGRQE